MIAKIIIIVLMFSGLAIHAAKHGEDQGKYNFVAKLFALIIQCILFYYAGLFEGIIK